MAGEIPAAVVADADRTLAFRDIDPQAPVHLLVIPKDHHADAAALAASDPALLADLLSEATRVAAAEGLADTGYRLVLNTGRDGGQEVPHVHAHVLGGRRLGWPPG